MIKSIRLLLRSMLCVLLLTAATHAAQVFVPNFSIGDDYVQWYYGCGPTAGGSIALYWDRNGYSNLVTGAIEDHIASTRHIEYWYESPINSVRGGGGDPDYNSTGDPKVGSDGFDCIADFMGTSRYTYPRPDAGNYELTNGGTYLWMGAPDTYLGIRSGMKAYANYQGYSIDATNYNADLWNTFTGEIDAGRPVILLVDTDGDGGTDHFVPSFGYDDTGKYFAYNEWGATGAVGDGGNWYDWNAMGVAWGVGYVTALGFGGGASPEPTAACLILLTGLAGIRSIRRESPAAG
jgi:hypothetical protein